MQREGKGDQRVQRKRVRMCTVQARKRRLGGKRRGWVEEERGWRTEQGRGRVPLRQRPRRAQRGNLKGREEGWAWRQQQERKEVTTTAVWQGMMRTRDGEEEKEEV